MKLKEQKKELLIHFTDYTVITNSLKDDLGITHDKEDLRLILSLCDNLEQLKSFLTQEEIRNVCFKASNYLVKYFEVKYNVKIKKYTKQNWK